MTEVIVAFPKMEDAKVIKNILVKNGYSVMGISTSGSSAISLADSLNGGILVSAYQFNDMVYSELRVDLSERFEMLLVCNPARMAGRVEEGIVYLPLPLKVHDFVDTMDMMSARLLRERKKRRLNPKARSEADIQVIEQAKSLLMNRNTMSEEEAHKYLQKCSMENRSNLVETAQMVISLNG